MGNESSSSGSSSSTTSSLGDYSNKESFGQAFKAAHSSGGSGHTFTYNGKLYNTNCADGGDYRSKPDTSSLARHKVHEYGHTANAYLKDNTPFSLDSYNNIRNEVENRNLSSNFSSDVDRRRAEYHRREYNKKSKSSK